MTRLTKLERLKQERQQLIDLITSQEWDDYLQDTLVKRLIEVEEQIEKTLGCHGA